MLLGLRPLGSMLFRRDLNPGGRLRFLGAGRFRASVLGLVRFIVVGLGLGLALRSVGSAALIGAL